MIKTYTYPLYSGNKDIGVSITLNRPLYGLFLDVTEGPGIYKQKYGKKYRVIRFPIKVRTILDDGVKITVTRYIDVRRKSKKQLKLLTAYSGTY